MSEDTTHDMPCPMCGQFSNTAKDMRIQALERERENALTDLELLQSDYRELQRDLEAARGQLRTMVLELNRNSGRISEETLTEAERILGEGDGRV